MLQLGGGGTWKSGHCFHEPPVSDSQLFAVSALREKSFLGLRWLTAVSCRGVGGDGDAGSSLQGVLSPEVSACLAVSYG